MIVVARTRPVAGDICGAQEGQDDPCNFQDGEREGRNAQGPHLKACSPCVNPAEGAVALSAEDHGRVLCFKLALVMVVVVVIIIIIIFIISMLNFIFPSVVYRRCARQILPTLTKQSRAHYFTKPTTSSAT